MKEPETLQQAILYFSDSSRCHAYLISRLWPDGVKCPRCHSDKVVFQERYTRWQCASHHPRRQFTIKTGTVFEDSPLSLDKWLTAMWMLANCKNGISSYEIARSLGVTQKTAWFMMHRLRLALHNQSRDKLSGDVEADETYIGGLARNMHKNKRGQKIKGTGGSGKSIVLGMLERRGKVAVRVIPNTQRHTLQGEIQQRIAPGAQLYTDEWVGYRGLNQDYLHHVIHHARSYAKGKVHTNGIENFWSLLKRVLKGTYVSVEPFHLFRYLDEQAYRFNERKATDQDRFIGALSSVSGRHVTYRQLIGQTSH